MDKIYTFDFAVFIDGFLMQRGRAGVEAENAEAAMDKLTGTLVEKMELDFKTGEKLVEFDLHNVSKRISSIVTPGH